METFDYFVFLCHEILFVSSLVRIMVLDDGHIVEFDSPNKLLERQGVFYGLVKDAGLL